MKFSGIASFAQQRIFLDEQVRFSNEIAIYNELNALQVVRGTLSVDHLLRAIQFIFRKHTILHTSLIFSNTDSAVQQCISNNHETFTIVDRRVFENENDLMAILYELTVNPRLFDLSVGRVFHCEILRQKDSITTKQNRTLVTSSDVVVIAFHHAAYDRSSRMIFFNDLCMAYNSNTAKSIDEESLQYIDYAVHECQMDMNLSRDFWHSELQGYNFECRLSLPNDRQRSSTDRRSGVAALGEISFENNVAAAFLNYASSRQLTPFQLGLALFYAFLFKLTSGQNDLCVTCLNANRYRNELQDLIGMFIATLPYRIPINSHWSFDELVKHVQEKSLSILSHSNYPLQHMLADFHLNQSNIPFLDTVFDFITVPSGVEQLSFSGATLKHVSLQQSSEVAKFDFMLMFNFNPALDDNRLSCRFICSNDLFSEIVVNEITQRFQQLFSQLFGTTSSSDPIGKFHMPLRKLTLVLPEEVSEIQNTIFSREANIVNEGTCFQTDFAQCFG